MIGQVVLDLPPDNSPRTTHRADNADINPLTTGRTATNIPGRHHHFRPGRGSYGVGAD